MDINGEYRNVYYYPAQVGMQGTAVIVPITHIFITHVEWIVCTLEFPISWSSRVLEGLDSSLIERNWHSREEDDFGNQLTFAQ